MSPLRQTVNSLLGRALSGNTAAPPAATPAPSGFATPEPRAPFPDAGAGARVVLYVESWCSDSRKAERVCVERGWPTHREDLENRHGEKTAMFKANQWRTLPMVTIDGRFVGGLKELQALAHLP